MWEIVLALFLGAVVSGVLPLVNAELLVVGAAALVSSAALPLVALAATVGQMLSKTALYALARWLPSRLPARARARVSGAATALEARGGALGPVVLASAGLGVPPFYAVSLACGALRVRLRTFLVAGSLGRGARFTALAWLGATLGAEGLEGVGVATAGPAQAAAALGFACLPFRGTWALRRPLAALAATVALVLAPGPAVGQSSSPPAWVTAGVPDTVWKLVERATSEADDDRARLLLVEAEAAARLALQESHGDPVGRRFAVAVVLGVRADREGGATKVRAASQLYQELDTILALDPEHARARHMLGRLHAGVRRMNRVTRWIATRLLGGGVLESASWAEAERNLAFAERQAPEVADHHLQLARLLFDTGRPGDGVRELEHVLALRAASPRELAARDEALRLWQEVEEPVPAPSSSHGRGTDR